MLAQTFSRNRGPVHHAGRDRVHVMPCGPSSSAKLLVTPRKPHFDAE
jgi:hypothetical protein